MMTIDLQTAPMLGFARTILAIVGLSAAFSASAQAVPRVVDRVVDIATRAGVTERFLLLVPGKPEAVAVLLAGGNGRLALSPEGRITQLGGNFLVRSRELFAEQGLAVAVLDAPSDRQTGMALDGFRTSAEHVADLAAAIGWLRSEFKLPVWLVGTSRGTETAAYVATRLARAVGGPDGIVLSSSILRDPRGRPVTAMDLEKIALPVLVVHHRNDGCWACEFQFVPELERKLSAAPRKEVLAFEGGISTGNECGARAYHGYNGIEREVVEKIATWMKTR